MRLVPVLFMFFKKTLYEVKERGSQAIALNFSYNKNKLYKTFRLLIQRYTYTLNSKYFEFSEKDLEIAPPTGFDFSRKMFLILYSIN